MNAFRMRDFNEKVRCWWSDSGDEVYLFMSSYSEALKTPQALCV